MSDIYDQFKNFNEFHDQYINFVKNIKECICKVEGAENLSEIFNQVANVGKEAFVKKFKNKERINTEKLKDADKWYLYLASEMKFLNYKCKNNENTLAISKWLEAAGIIMESIGNYFKIPFLDIIKEIIQLGSIYSR